MITGSRVVAEPTTAGADLLAPYVPRAVAHWPADGRIWQRVEGTLVSADISGFTALSERLAGLGREGAEELTDLVNECFEGMIAHAEAQGGDVLKFGGDALLILFTGEDHAVRSCLAATGMRASIARPLSTRTVRRVTLRMSQGVHSGHFDLFLVDVGHRELLLTGPGVTATVEAEAAASAGEILLSPAAAALVPPRWVGPGSSLRNIEVPAPAPVAAPRPLPDRDLTAFVPPVQRDQIGAMATGEHRRVTVGFVKFSGTDALLERLGPAEVGARLQRLATVVAEAADAHGAHWLASDVYPDGGKVILTAGAPLSTGDDETAALRTVRTVLDADVGLPLRAGVNAGPVFVGDLGAHRRRAFTVMGDAVNLAARLMQKALPGQLVASQATLDRSSTAFDERPLEPFLVKGKARPVEAAAVLAVAADHRRIDGVHELPFVGRDDELATVTELIAAVDRSGIGQVIDVIGDAGSGKSRLLRAVRSGLGDRAVVTAVGGRYTANTPYFAVRGMVRGLLGIADDLGREEAGTHLLRAVAECAPGLSPWTPLLAIPADATVPSTPEVDRLAPEFRRDRLHEALVELLDALVGGPLLLVAENADRLDEASRALIHHLAWTAAERPWTMVVNRRPDGAGLADDAPHRAELRLRPLPDDAARTLAVAATTTDLLPAALDRIVARAGGLPLFIVELARAATGSEDDDSLPETVEALVTARIDSLVPGRRRLLREASVLGTTVEVELLTGALGAGADARAWGDLGEFLAPAGPGRLRFRETLYREVAYEGLSYRRRRQVHEQVGRAIEARSGLRADEVASLLSLHFHAAGAAAETWRYSTVAGAQARERFANADAAALYRRALDMAPRLPGLTEAELADTWEALGDVSELAARYDGAGAAYDAARRRQSDPVARVRLLRKAGLVRERQGRYSQAVRWYGRALAMAELLPEGRVEAMSELAVAYAATRYRQGRFAECARWAQRAIDEAEPAGLRRTVAHASYLMENALTSLGRREALEWRNRALPIFRELGDLVGEANALNNLGCTAYYEGRWDDALAHFRESHAARDAAGDVMGSATELSNVGEVLSDQGRLEEAIELTEDALRTWRAANYPVGVAQATANLARAKARLGHADEASQLLVEATAQFERLGASAFVAEMGVREVELAVLGGRHADALRLADEVAARLRTGTTEEIVSVTLQRLRGWSLLRSGRADEARDAFAGARQRAEDLHAGYERALCLLGLAEIDASPEHRADAEALFRQLGVVAVPAIP